MWLVAQWCKIALFELIHVATANCNCISTKKRVNQEILLKNIYKSIIITITNKTIFMRSLADRPPTCVACKILSARFVCHMLAGVHLWAHMRMCVCLINNWNWNNEVVANVSSNCGNECNQLFCLIFHFCLISFIYLFIYLSWVGFVSFWFSV